MYLKLFSNVIQKCANRIEIGGCNTRLKDKRTRPMKQIRLGVAESLFATQKIKCLFPVPDSSLLSQLLRQLNHCHTQCLKSVRSSLY